MADGEHAFDLATAVRGGPGSWTATVDPGWTAAGPAELEVTPLRAGRSLSTARVTLAQDGRPLLEALVSAGQLAADGAPEWQRASSPPDPLALLQAVDALPPTSFELGIPTWAPTVELTVYLRGLPAPGGRPRPSPGGSRRCRRRPGRRRRTW